MKGGEEGGCEGAYTRVSVDGRPLLYIIRMQTKKNHYAETLNDTVISGLENSYWRFLPPANNFLALFES